jgi:hypothetical protein
MYRCFHPSASGQPLTPYSTTLAAPLQQMHTKGIDKSRLAWYDIFAIGKGCMCGLWSNPPGCVLFWLSEAEAEHVASQPLIRSCQPCFGSRDIRVSRIKLEP